MAPASASNMVNRKRSWKMERASVWLSGKQRKRSNKYSKQDTKGKPAKHSRKGMWVGGYRRKDGGQVNGYYRTNGQYFWRRKKQ